MCQTINWNRPLDKAHKKLCKPVDLLAKTWPKNLHDLAACSTFSNTGVSVVGGMSVQQINEALYKSAVEAGVTREDALATKIAAIPVKKKEGQGGFTVVQLE